MRHIDGSWIMFWVSWNVHSSSVAWNEREVRKGRERRYRISNFKKKNRYVGDSESS